MPSIYDWSLTAASNANSDSGINWAEGQAPSTVNNSARVMMARIKSLLNDLGGVNVSGGTANVITLTSSSAFSSLDDGLRVSFRAAASNTSSATLNVNGLGAKPVVKMTLYGESALIGGEVQEDGIYEAVYSTILNGASGAWLLLNPSQTEVIPSGFGGPYFGGTVPSGWLLCNGAAVSRTTYARLFTAVGTTWGAGDGSTTFNLPDGRDDFLRGASGTNPLGTRQADMLKEHTHTVTDPGHDHDVAFVQGTDAAGTGERLQPYPSTGSYSTSTATTGITVDNTGGAETRPRNIAVNWIIKA